MTAAPYRITALAVKDFKRVRDVTIAPGVDAAFVLIGGDNAQGKTSILDALECAFGGKEQVPADPVRHGAERAEIRIELAATVGGDPPEALTIRRVIQPDGKTALEVRDAFGAVKAPQALLNKLIGASCIDPLSFLGLAAKEQRAMLLRLVDRENKIPALEQTRERVFTKRRDVGRDHDKAKGELARIAVVDPGESIDIDALAVEARGIEESLRRSDRLAKDAEIAAKAQAAARAEVLAIQAEIERQTERLRLASLDHEQALAKSNAADALARAETAKLPATHQRRGEVAAELKRATEHNAHVAKIRAIHARALEVGAEVQRLGAEYDTLTARIDEIDATKAAILTSAAMPVDGLTVDAEFVRYNGVPLAQASRAEQYLVAISTRIAFNPELADIWIRDGSLFDDTSLGQIVAIAASCGRRLWIERVGARDPGAIIIHEGALAESKVAPTAQQPLFADRP